MQEKLLLKLMSPWAETREKLKEANTSLTDEDLDYVPGRDEQLLDHLGKKMNRSREEIKSWIESVSANKGKAS